jgi:hypothetical protein|tara:strand:- start:144 stop:500 length:357 start_codon:yes stop_codon:yes gene_type:complete
MKEKKTNLVGAMMYLHDNGIKEIIINYSGGGDSGAIDEIFFQDNNNNDTEFHCDSLVKTFIEELAYTKLNEIEDWYNNDGGWGHFTITVPTAEYNIENYIKVIDHETFNHEGQFESEE